MIFVSQQREFANDNHLIHLPDPSVYPANVDVIYASVEVEDAPFPPSVKLAVHYPQFEICTLSFSLFPLILRLICCQIPLCIRLSSHTPLIVLQAVKSTPQTTTMQVCHIGCSHNLDISNIVLMIRLRGTPATPEISVCFSRN